MSIIETKSKFHVALDGVGLLLQGAPDRLAYQQTQAPIYGNRFAAGDRSYGDFSFWWFWAQTDFSGGYKVNRHWADDAKVMETYLVNVVDNPGAVRLNWAFNENNLGHHFTFWDAVQGEDEILFVGFDNDAEEPTIVDGSGDATNDAGQDYTVLCAENHGDVAYLGCSGVGGGGSTLKLADFTDVGTFTHPIAAIISDPNTARLILFTTDDGIYELALDTTTFAQLQTEYPYSNPVPELTFLMESSSSGEHVGKPVWRIGSNAYFLMRNIGTGNRELWAYALDDDVLFLVYQWGAGTNVDRMIARDASLYIFGVNSNVSRVQTWKFDTSAGSMDMIQEIGRESQTSSLWGGATKDSTYIFINIVLVDTLTETSTTQIWQIDKTDVFFGGVGLPESFVDGESHVLAVDRDDKLFAVFSDGMDNDAVIASYSNTPPDSFQTSGYIVTSEYDGDIPALDKLFYDLTFNFNELKTGEAIEVYYSIDFGANYSFMGSANFEEDGAISSKRLLFGDETVAKQMILRFVLTNGSGTTPFLTSFSARLVPFITYKKQWQIFANCADEVKRIDGALTELTARELRGRLERAWWTKSILDYQDFDYAGTVLVDQSFDFPDVEPDATTIRVEDTSDFPEQGRIRIGDEEILYTGKTPYTFTGCIRGARETTAAQHNTGTEVNNAYRVIITDLQGRIPIALEDKELEYIVGISLREV